MTSVVITRGAPTDEEVAALVAALLTLRADAAPPPPVSRWARSARPQPQLGLRGPETWRASGLPRAR